MRKFSLMMIAALCAGWALQGFAQHSVTIKGKVKFIDKDFKVSVYQRSGTDKKILAEVPTNTISWLQKNIKVLNSTNDSQYFGEKVASSASKFWKNFSSQLLY